jgi:hypothetical protein
MSSAALLLGNGSVYKAVTAVLGREEKEICHVLGNLAPVHVVALYLFIIIK